MCGVRRHLYIVSLLTLFLFHCKLKCLKSTIQELNRTRYGDIQQCTQEAFYELCVLQPQALQHQSDNIFQEVTIATKKWNHLLEVEERLFR